MYILQISDLHITNSINVKDIFHKIDLLIDGINKNIEDGSSLACCILGDIIDMGDVADFEVAEKIVEYFLLNLKNIKKIKKLKLFFVPGNHDLTENVNHKKNNK